MNHRETITHLLVASGRQPMDQDGTSFRLWWLTSSLLTDEEALYVADNPHRTYRGPGRWFSDEPHIRRVGKRCLITQFIGQDI